MDRLRLRRHRCSGFWSRFRDFEVAVPAQTLRERVSRTTVRACSEFRVELDPARRTAAGAYPVHSSTLMTWHLLSSLSLICLHIDPATHAEGLVIPVLVSALRASHYHSPTGNTFPTLWSFPRLSRRPVPSCNRDRPCGYAMLRKDADKRGR